MEYRVLQAIDELTFAIREVKEAPVFRIEGNCLYIDFSNGAPSEDLSDLDIMIAHPSMVVIKYLGLKLAHTIMSEKRVSVIDYIPRFLKSDEFEGLEVVQNGLNLESFVFVSNLRSEKKKNFTKKRSSFRKF